MEMEGSRVYEAYQEVTTHLAPLGSMQPVIICKVEEFLNFRSVKTLDDAPRIQSWEKIRLGKGL